MQTKLTLRMDDGVIQRAKHWARERGVTLSGTVAEFLAALPKEGVARDLDPWTQRLAGAAAGEASASTDEELLREDLDRLEEKYR